MVGCVEASDFNLSGHSDNAATGELTSILRRGHERARDRDFKLGRYTYESALPDEQEALEYYSRNPKLAKEDCGAPKIASAFGYRKLLEQFIDLKVDLYAEKCREKNFGQTPLTGAAMNGQLSTVKLLVETKAAKIDETAASYWANGYMGPFRDGGDTALILAASEGHVDVVKYLLERGAMPNKKSSRGWRAIDWARKRSHEAVIAMLLPFDDKVSQRDLDLAKSKRAAKSEPHEWGRVFGIE